MIIISKIKKIILPTLILRSMLPETHILFCLSLGVATWLLRGEGEGGRFVKNISCTAFTEKEKHCPEFLHKPILPPPTPAKLKWSTPK